MLLKKNKLPCTMSVSVVSKNPCWSSHPPPKKSPSTYISTNRAISFHYGQSTKVSQTIIQLKFSQEKHIRLLFDTQIEVKNSLYFVSRRRPTNQLRDRASSKTISFLNYWHNHCNLILPLMSVTKSNYLILFCISHYFIIQKRSNVCPKI
jgi:hypothetical protein